MKIIKEAKQLIEEIAIIRQNNPKSSIGFVPTMGALHEGHISLVKEAKRQSSVVVTSIFVNPTQFNDLSDLDRYPRTEQEDINLLEQEGCDIIFLPDVNEMYPNGKEPYEIDLGGLDLVMEGQYRENHFEGVCMIVEKFFGLVKPDKAFFGLKDFQQVAIIKRMVEVRNLNIEICPCPIKREKSGLAMSSRNMLLSDRERQDARILNWVLRLGKQLVSEGKSLDEVKEHMLALFNLGKLKLEYMEIVNNTTLQRVNTIEQDITCCIVAYSGKVRLIDNIQLN